MNFCPTLCLLSSGALAAFISSIGHAQPIPTSPQVLELERIEVTSDRARSFTVPALNDARLTLALTPGGTEVVDAERYLRGRASTLADTFALSAGVFAQSRFGSDEARLSIRGSGLQRTFHGRGLRVLQDGVPLNLADGSFDMQAIEPLSAAYINVWRGGNALAQGASTLGGALDYISRTGRDHDRGFARVEIGSHGYIRASVAGGGFTDNKDTFASYTYQAQDGYRAHAKQENHRAFANAGLRWGDHAETRFYLTAVHTDSELPGNLTRAQAADDPRQAATGNVALDQKRDFDLVRLATRTSLQTGSTSWDFMAAWSYKDLDHPIFQVIDQLSNDVVIGGTLTRRGDVAGLAYRLRAGAFLNRGVTQAANFINVGGSRGAMVSSARQTATNVEGFIETHLTLRQNLTAVVGAALARNQRRNERRVGGAPDYNLTFNDVMPKVGLRHDGRYAQLYANVSASYEPPSFSETLTLNTARDAQTATTWEIGTRGTRGPVRFDLSHYHAAVRKELLTIDDDNTPSTPAATINADRTVHQGTEFSIDWDLLGSPWETTDAPAHRLVLRAAWTHGDFRFDDDQRYGNNTLAGLPPHLVRGELTWENRHGWYAGPTFEWVPEKTWIDHRNTFAARPHALAGFRLGRRAARGLSWFFEVRNVFDENTIASTGVIEDARGIDQPQFLPGEGRGYFGGGEYRW